jgi:hypothetical protein
MKKIFLSVLLGMFLFVGCVVGPGPRGSAVVVVPALPSIVVLESEPYYYQDGYHYHYQGDRWSYSNSRNGPWVELPRDHYPREVRYKGRDDGRGKGDERGKGGKGDRD